MSGGGTPTAAAWQRFWFAPASTAPLGLLRIALGAVTLAWALTLVGDLAAFFGPAAVGPPATGTLVVDPLTAVDATWAVVATWGLLVVAALALTVGLWSRVAAITAFLAMLTLGQRNPYVLNSGDLLLRNLLFLLALAPSGAALSLDRWRRHREAFWSAPLGAPWVLRLVQVQLSVVYLATVWAKVQGRTWNDGTAVSLALRITDHTRLPLPGLLTDDLLLANLATYGTLALELSLGVLVWNRTARPLVLAAGVAFHLVIEWAFLVGFFSATVLAAYLAFVPGDVADRWVGRVEEKATATRRSSSRSSSSAVAA